MISIANFELIDSRYYYKKTNLLLLFLDIESLEFVGLHVIKLVCRHIYYYFKLFCYSNLQICISKRNVPIYKHILWHIYTKYSRPIKCIQFAIYF